MLQVDDKNLYCVCETMDEPIIKSSVKTIDENDTEEADTTIRKSGVWMFDLQQLICNGRFEGYRFGKSLVGVARHLILGNVMAKICM